MQRMHVFSSPIPLHLPLIHPTHHCHYSTSLPANPVLSVHDLPLAHRPLHSSLYSACLSDEQYLPYVLWHLDSFYGSHPRSHTVTCSISITILTGTHTHHYHVIGSFTFTSNKDNYSMTTQSFYHVYSSNRATVAVLLAENFFDIRPGINTPILGCFLNRCYIFLFASCISKCANWTPAFVVYMNSCTVFVSHLCSSSDTKLIASLHFPLTSRQ